MKLIEIVVLLGAQCISPVQHSAATTEVQKVQCAVVIERDTAAGTVRIVPAGASTRPEVVAVLDRIDGDEGQRIAPAAAPPPDPTAPAQAAVAEPAPAIAPPPDQVTAAAEKPVKDASPAAEAVKAEPAPAAELEPKPAAQTSAETAGEAPAPGIETRCKGKAVARWYTNDEGRKKYRCVLPG
ncbi:MAG: hypothetical protein IOC86_11835 [Aestuariivirga sp.]|nr:hypothetical protein [Aestuariivirga sp.]